MTTKRRRLPSGLQERKGRFYYETRHPRLDRGRMVVALRTEALDLAIERRQAVVTLMERGDWAVVQRIRSGDLHITDVQAAVREGKVRELRRVGHAPTILKDAVLQFLQRTEATAGSRRTYDAYRGATTVLLGHLGDDYPMQDLTVQGAEEFLHGPRKSGAVWAANTQRANRWTYSALWSLAIEREREQAERLSLEPELVRNPWKDVRVPEFRQTRVVFLEPAEWWRLVPAAGDGHRLDGAGGVERSDPARVHRMARPTDAPAHPGGRVSVPDAPVRDGTAAVVDGGGWPAAAWRDWSLYARLDWYAIHGAHYATVFPPPPRARPTTSEGLKDE